MKRLFTKRGQSTAEYAILIALVIGAAIAMQTYVKRSLQGGTKYAVDKLDAGSGQYEPYYLMSEYTATNRKYEETEQTLAGGEIERTIGKGASGQQQIIRSGKQQMRDTSFAD